MTLACVTAKFQFIKRHSIKLYLQMFGSKYETCDENAQITERCMFVKVLIYFLMNN